MKDSEGKIIYVGKSKKLKNRVSSYFVGTPSSYKTAKMVERVEDFDYIVCDTEIEALTLENVLIKKHAPRYNVKLKDAKSYPYIKITRAEYPRLMVTRERKSDKGRYFGPYSGASAAYTAMNTVCAVFSLPTCRRRFPEDIGKERPCLYRDMGKCIAPCTGLVTKEEYCALIKCAENVLDGDVGETKRLLTEKMNEAAEELEFERAAAYRDSIAALDRLSEKQKVVADEKVMRDVFALYVEPACAVLSVLTIRQGALVNKNQFVLSSAELEDAEDAVNLIVAYYDTAGSVPKEVMLDFSAGEDLELLAEYLTLLRGSKVTVRTPERGEGRALCDMALENAKEAAKQTTLEGDREDKNAKRLAELLGLGFAPNRIEAYDVSNLGDEGICASMVVWERGKMKKSDYRTFSIKSTDGRDDYGSMREALRRRLSHIGDGTASLSEAPDLILLDGGRGQLSAVKGVMEELGVDIPVYGMVKDDFHKTRALTELDGEISIAHEMGVYSFVYRIQEEAHRFAVKHTMGKKSRTLVRSTLENIEGIGPKKAKLLLKAMTLSQIKLATAEELSQIRGITRKDAERIYAHFHSSGEN